jgi:hypothetical protein
MRPGPEVGLSLAHRSTRVSQDSLAPDVHHKLRSFRSAERRRIFGPVDGGRPLRVEVMSETRTIEWRVSGSRRSSGSSSRIAIAASRSPLHLRRAHNGSVQYVGRAGRELRRRTDRGPRRAWLAGEDGFGDDHAGHALALRAVVGGGLLAEETAMLVLSVADAFILMTPLGGRG